MLPPIGRSFLPYPFRKDRIMKNIIALAALSIAGFAAVPCQAQPDAAEEGFIAFVPYGDLNLASAAGARTLENRIEAAADRICGFPKAPGLAETLRVQDCRDDVLNSARPQVSRALAMNDQGAIAFASR